MSTVLMYRTIIGKRTKIEKVVIINSLSEIEALVSSPPEPLEGGKEDQYLAYWGELIDMTRLEIAENYGALNSIVLDYDGSEVEEEVKFTEFYEKYNGKFQFYMHSSWNDVIKGVDKYRVIIPLEAPFYMTRPLKNVLLNIFKGVDPKTFDNRGFYLPVNRPNYRFAVSEGKILNISCFDYLVKAEIEAEHERIRLAAIEKLKYNNDTEGSDEHKERWLNKVKSTLDAMSWNRDGSGRYGKLVNVIYSMQKHDSLRFSAFEIEEFLDEYLTCLDSKNERSLRKLIEKGR